MRRAVALAAIALALLVAGLLLATRRRPNPPDAVPAGDEAPAARAGLRPVAAPTTGAPPLRDPGSAPLAADAEAVVGPVFALKDDADPVAVTDAITAAARRLCGDVDASRAVLDRALHAPDLPARAVRAALLALGRCGREEGLRDLVAALRDPATRVRDREFLVLSLAQQRTPDVGPPDGVVAMSIGDTTLWGPTRERFVRDALIELLAPPPTGTLRRRTGQADFRDLSRAMQLRITAIQALGLSAGDSDDALEALAALVRAEAPLRSTVLSSLAGAKSSARLTAFVRPIVEDRTADEGSLQTALSRWLQSDRTAAVDYVLSELASPDVPDARKAILIRDGAGMAAGRPDALPDVERLTLAAVAWARAHPKVVLRMEQDGPNRVPVELDMLRVAEMLLSSGYAASDGRSDLLRRPAAESLVAHLARISTKDERRRPPGWLSLEGDDAYLLLVLDGFRTVTLDDDTLLDVADVLTAPRPHRPHRSPAVAAAITRLLETLPPAARERLAARRAAK